MSTGTNEQMITGGELVAKALKAEGVEVIYTLCGGHIIDIYNGCLNEGIKIIDVRHEEVASHAADGYARMTGKPGCAVVTAGPGTTHALTGVANAFSELQAAGTSISPNAQMHLAAGGPAAPLTMMPNIVQGLFLGSILVIQLIQTWTTKK